jgi:hypothetical protein
MGSVLKDYDYKDYKRNGCFYREVYDELTDNEKLLMKLVIHENIEKGEMKMPSIERIKELSAMESADNSAITIGEAIKIFLMEKLPELVGIALSDFRWAMEAFEPMAEDLYNLHLRNIIKESDFSVKYEYCHDLQKSLRGAYSTVCDDIIRECQRINHNEKLCISATATDI